MRGGCYIAVKEVRKRGKKSCRHEPSGDNIWLSFRDDSVVASEVPFQEQFKPRETGTIS